jgi:hypothetical protein
VLLLLVVAGLFWWNGNRRPNGNPAAGVTVTQSPSGRAVPKDFVSCADGRLCPTTAACWQGPVVIAGNATARKTDCAQSHYLETFAAGYLPADAVGMDFFELQKREDIKQLCAMPVLLARRSDPATTGNWEWRALPVQVGPDWVVHCLASRVGENARTGTLFRTGP